MRTLIVHFVLVSILNIAPSYPRVLQLFLHYALTIIKTICTLKIYVCYTSSQSSEFADISFIKIGCKPFSFWQHLLRTPYLLFIFISIVFNLYPNFYELTTLKVSAMPYG